MNTSAINCLVAHRGDHEHVPENSLAAFRQALDAGAQWLECDVQITADGAPVIFHDEDTRRMCEKEGQIGQLRCEALFPLLDGQLIPRLQELLDLLAGYPQAKLFLEIKREILQFYSIAAITTTLDEMIRTREQIIPISMSSELLEHWWHIRQQPLGWIPAGPPPGIPLAYLLMPAEDFLQGKRPAPAEKIAVYTVNDAEFARHLLQQGADLVETDHFSKLQRLLNAE